MDSKQHQKIARSVFIDRFDSLARASCFRTVLHASLFKPVHLSGAQAFAARYGAVILHAHHDNAAVRLRVGPHRKVRSEGIGVNRGWLSFNSSVFLELLKQFWGRSFVDFVNGHEGQGTAEIESVLVVSIHRYQHHAFEPSSKTSIFFMLDLRTPPEEPQLLDTHRGFSRRGWCTRG